MARTTTATSKVPTAREVARAQRQHDNKQNRKDTRRAWLRSRAHRNRHHGVPLAIDTSALITGCIGHYADPTTAVITGITSAALVGIPAALSGMSERERGFTSGHGTGAAAWTVCSAVFGPFNPLVAATGALGAITAQFGWVESRKIRTTTSTSKADKKHAAQWNGTGKDEDAPGLLERAGLGGVVLVFTEVVWSADGQRRIGMNYHIDLAGSGKRREQAMNSAKAIEAELPGRARQGAVTMLDNEDDTNHVIAQVIWRKPWNEDTKLVHPIVEHFDEIADFVNAAIERKLSGGDGPEIEARDEIKHLLPNMATIRNPLYIGETTDGSPAHRKVWQKGHGAHHEMGIGKTGSGKTSDINSEIMSTLPTRDCLIWVIDVSSKRGKDFAGWGSCIDWMATEINEATAMLRNAINIADGRGKEYRKGGNVTPGTAPTIRIIIDEFSALYKALQDVVFSTLGRLTKEGRSQNVSVEVWSQRGTQDDFGYGFATIRSQFTQSVALQVKDEGEVGFVLSDPNVPGDPTKWGKGEGIEEDGLTGKQVHRKSCFIDQGDEDDELDLGVIPEIAALYAPFRPALDDKSLKYTDKHYANRNTNRPDNPLLTPAIVAEKHQPEPIENDDELAERVERISTNTQWLSAFLNGEFRVNTSGEFASDAEQENDDMSDTDTPTMNLSEMAAQMGITSGDDYMGREERSTSAQAEFEHADAKRGTQLAELDQRIEQIPTEHASMSMAEAFGQAEVTMYSDDDPLKSFCVAELGKASTKGIPTGTIASRYAERTGEKAPSTTTVVARLKCLHAEGKSKVAGAGRGVRWYRPDQAPDDAR